MKIKRSRGKSGWQHRAEENPSHGIRSTVAGYFLHLFCTKNKLMKSFKFTGISICCFISHRLADNPTCGEVQHFCVKTLRGSRQTKAGWIW